MSKFAEMLSEHGLTSGPVFATGLLKGHEAARMVADAKAQETIRPMTAIVLSETEEAGSVAHLVDRFAAFYHSDYVKHNQAYILETPFEEWRDRELAKRGLTIE